MIYDEARVISELDRINAEWRAHDYGDDLHTVFRQVCQNGLTMDESCAILTEHVRGLSVGKGPSNRDEGQPAQQAP